MCAGLFGPSKQEIEASEDRIQRTLIIDVIVGCFSEEELKNLEAKSSTGYVVSFKDFLWAYYSNKICVFYNTTTAKIISSAIQSDWSKNKNYSIQHTADLFSVLLDNEDSIASSIKKIALDIVRKNASPIIPPSWLMTPF